MELPFLKKKLIQMFEIFSNFFILYGQKWKKKGKESYAFRSCFNQISKSQLFLFRVFKFHFAKYEGARTQFSN